MLEARALLKAVALLLVGAASVLLPSLAAAQSEKSVSTTGVCSPIVIDAGGNVTNNINCPITLSEEQLAQLNEAIAKAASSQAALAGPWVKRVETLSGELQVQRSALENFFRILKEKNVKPGELDNALRQIATRHLELTQRLAKSAETGDPEIRETLADAKADIEQGNYERADGLLARAEELDLRAIAQQQEELGARKLRAAETRAERGELSRIVLDALEAGRHYAGAARIVPSSHPLVVAQYANLAGNAFQDGGAYERAEEQYARSLSLRERHLEPNDPDIAQVLNNLSALYHHTGRYAEVEPLIERALAIAEAALGPDHPTVALYLTNLANLYSVTGRNAEAELLFKRALAIDEAPRRPDHLHHLAARLRSVARFYHVTGRSAEAEPLLQRALAIKEAALGPDHPAVAQLLVDIARFYHTTGRSAEAEPLQRRALAINEAALGRDHPAVAQVLDDIARFYHVTGRYAEAEPLFQRALAINEAALGPDHPAVAIHLNALAALYYETGRSAEAEPLFQRALAIDEAALGSDHPHTKAVRANLQKLRIRN